MAITRIKTDSRLKTPGTQTRATAFIKASGTTVKKDAKKVVKAVKPDPVAYDITLPPHSHFIGKTTGHITAFSILRSDNTWTAFPGQGCHGAMNYASKPDDIAIMTATWVSPEGDKVASEEYWRFIFDKKESPWRSLLKDTPIYELLDKNDELAAIGIKIPKGVIFGNLMNLLVATRAPWERPSAVRMWKKLWSDDGFTKTEALFIVAHVAPSDVYVREVNKDTLLGNTSGYGHWAFDAWSVPMDFKMFKESDLQPGSKTPYGNRGYGSINSTWHAGPREKASKFVGVIAKTKMYNGIFQKHWQVTVGSDRTMNKKRVPINYGELVKLVKEGRDVWC